MAFEGLSDKLSAAFQRMRNKGKLTEADVTRGRCARFAWRCSRPTSTTRWRRILPRTRDRSAASAPEVTGEPDALSAWSSSSSTTSLIAAHGRRGQRRLNAAPGTADGHLCSAACRAPAKPPMRGKLGRMLKKQGQTVLCWSRCDIYRPAAIDQLKVVGESGWASRCFERGTQEPGQDRARRPIAHAEGLRASTTVLLDTAGRLHVDEELMNELRRIKAELRAERYPAGGRRYDRTGRGQRRPGLSRGHWASAGSSLPSSTGTPAAARPSRCGQ